MIAAALDLVALHDMVFLNFWRHRLGRFVFGIDFVLFSHPYLSLSLSLSLSLTHSVSPSLIFLRLCFSDSLSRFSIFISARL